MSAVVNIYGNFCLVSSHKRIVYAAPIGNRLRMKTSARPQTQKSKERLEVRSITTVADVF